MNYRVVITQASDIWHDPTFVSPEMAFSNAKSLYRKTCGLPEDEPMLGGEGMHWSGGSRDFEGMGVWLIPADDFNRKVYKR